MYVCMYDYNHNKDTKFNLDDNWETPLPQEYTCLSLLQGEIGWEMWLEEHCSGEDERL